VVSGRPVLRTPEGERELVPGDCVHFASGPEGAHQVLNRSDEVVRVLVVSSFALPRAAVQVDSGKIMIRWGAGAEARRWFRSTPRSTTGTARPSHGSRRIAAREVCVDSTQTSLARTSGGLAGARAGTLSLC
jgi:uncharacterized cupin superfamily protein